MANEANIRHVIENSPRLWFAAKTRVVQHLDGRRESYTISADTLVDYERKIAKKVTVTARHGQSSQVTAYYKNGECQVKYFSSAEKEVQHETVTFSAEEFAELFAAQGQLRPFSFEYLAADNRNEILDNTLTYTLNFPSELDACSNDVRSSSNVILSVCSDDTLKINSLMHQVIPENSGLMTLDTEILVHTYDGEVID